eukprot:6779629-Prymnesium_polylepis.1
MELGRRLRADSATELTGFERIFTRPTAAQLRGLKRRKSQREDRCTRTGRRATWATHGNYLSVLSST